MKMFKVRYRVAFRSLNPARKMSMQRRQFILGLAGVSSAAMLGCQTQPVPEGYAPRLTGKTVDGDYLALDDFAGKIVLLNIWATWCPPCRQELPELQRLHQAHGGERFTVLGVSIDTEGAAPRVAAMVKQQGLTYPVMLDPRASSVEPYDVRGYPTSFLIGPDRKFLWRRDGAIRVEDPGLTKVLEPTLNRWTRAPT